MIGKTLGHYQISSQLGKGGMGEVYQAKDQVLGRDVAIKVLPEEFAKDADRVARFQREAKLLASLNHPNIATIHGLEEAGGKQFLVMELVEGETLADRIKAGPIPVEESLKLALQIAEALEAAHEKNVIHRDLKPANIKVTPDGKVKVLDFGLAKAFAGEQTGLNLSNSPTLSDMATMQGVILGTAAYMSPEQAKGKTIDKRADIWAFGAVLFEMLTRRPLFTGETVSETLAAVLLKEPDFSTLPPNLHSRIRLLLERCLEKEARNRYSGIADARVDIQKVLADPGGVSGQPGTTMAPGNGLRTLLPWIAAALVLGAILAGVAIWNLKPAPPPEPRPVTRFYYELPENQHFLTLQERALAVSPDGRQFVYGTDQGLCLRSLGKLEASLIPGTDENAERPFFSPDGKWVGYWSRSDNQLKKIAVSGGAPVAIADNSSIGFFSWGMDDTIVYSQGRNIMGISAKGGNPKSLVEAGKQGDIVVSPQILPDGKSVMFTSPAPLPMKIKAHSLESGNSKELFEGVQAQYVPTGHIIYGVGNNLFAVPFNLDRLEVTGWPVSVIEGVAGSERSAMQFAVSDSGTLVYIPTTAGTTSTGKRLVWVDRKGKEESLAAAPNNYRSLKISPDGTRVALGVAGINSDIWIWDLVREAMTRLTFDGAENGDPVWTVDGRQIVFASNPDKRLPGIYRKAADGTGEAEHLLSANDRLLAPASWSNDGRALVLSEIAISPMQRDIGMLSMDGERKRMPLLEQRYGEWQPQISPDGRWMAYVSNESGQREIYVRPFPEVNKGRWQISTSGGESPLWSPQGRELFYRSGDAVMAVAVSTEQAFKSEKPSLLFRGSYASVGLVAVRTHPWDISPDGKRFLMLKEAADTGRPAAEMPRKINIVLNWFEELKQRVPVK